MILSKKAILSAIEQGNLTIDPFAPEMLKEASYTFTLDRQIKLLAPNQRLDLSSATYTEHIMDDTGFVLEPGAFAVGYTREKLTLYGKYACVLSVRGSIAALGLNGLLTDTFCEPDTDNTIALPMHNASGMPMVLTPGLAMVKGIFIPVR
jgi:dCTP deaminase